MVLVCYLVIGIGKEIKFIVFDTLICEAHQPSSLCLISFTKEVAIAPMWCHVAATMAWICEGAAIRGGGGGRGVEPKATSRERAVRL